MKIRTVAMMAALTAALATQASSALAASKYECYEEATAPKPASVKDRASVKAEITGKAYTCFDEASEPKAGSTAKRADVKAEAKRAVKAGETTQGEGGATQKK